ncbi:MAG: hypothetical protein COA58_11660 [Bacteroidetes bacterium]|nr:MAG: hypothetical protein COA58_11660 [Bacteroidota bacterium]
MKILSQLKWQLMLLHKNNIINISIGVTVIYGVILFLIKDVGSLDVVLISIVLNDPSVIGYFFIALAIYTEIKHEILPAIFTTPINLHHYIISKVMALSVVGIVCALGLAFFVKGFDFDIINYAIGTLGICLLSALLGLIMLTFASEFLKFAMISIPVFLTFINVPLLQYLGVFDMGLLKYVFPAQGSINLIDNGISGTEINLWATYISIFFWITLFYSLAYKLFKRKVICQ